jgi:hypothetical protein
MRKPIQLGLVVLFTAVALAYSAVWMYSVRWEPAWNAGFEFDGETLRIATVEPNGAADFAGLKIHDEVISLDGEPVASQLELLDRMRDLKPGDAPRLTVRMGGLGNLSSYDVDLLPKETQTGQGSWLGAAARQIVWSFPLLILLVVVPVLYLRADLRNAWLMALFFLGVIATAPLVSFYVQIPPGLRPMMMAFKVLAGGTAPALLYYFFAVFPESSPLDDRLPWLKTGWLAAASAVATPFALWILVAGADGLYRSELASFGFGLTAISWVAAFALGLLSLFSTAVESGSEIISRKARIVAYGTAAALLPAVVLQLVSLFTGAPGYALAAREVLDTSGLLRRIARNLLVQRGSIGLLLVAGVVVGLASRDWVSRLLQDKPRAAAVVGILCGLLLGAGTFVAARWGHGRVVRQIDRLLFRKEYEIAQVLEGLAEDMRSITTGPELAAAIDQRLQRAFEPSSVAVYLAEDELLRVECGEVPSDLTEIPLDAPMLPAAPRKTDDKTQTGRPISKIDRVEQLGPDCLVPIGGGESGLLGLVVLGPRSSKEPYSGADRRLLAAVGQQAGSALQTLDASND